MKTVKNSMKVEDQEKPEEHTFLWRPRVERGTGRPPPTPRSNQARRLSVPRLYFDPNEEPLNENHNIDELTKQLTNEDSEVTPSRAIRTT